MSFGSLAPDRVVGGQVGGQVGGPVLFLHLRLQLYSALGPRAGGQMLYSGLAQSRLLMSGVSSPGPEQSWAWRAWGGECAMILCPLWALGQ